MSPQHPRGINWTLIAVVMAAGANLVYIGKSSERIEAGLAENTRRLDARDKKDDMQDTRLLGHDIAISSMSTDVAAIKEGRYQQRERTSGVERGLMFGK